MSAFSFTMEQIGMTNPAYAYKLTYYTAPVNIDEISKVEVSNRFRLEGEIRKGDFSTTLSGVQSEVTVVVQGGYSLEATKHAWHYEGAKTASGPWSNGALCWVIQLDGTEVRPEIQFKDQVNKSSMMTFHEDSMVGVYVGAFPEGTGFTSYPNIDEVMKSGYITKLPESWYTVSYENSQGLSGAQAKSDVIISMNQKVELNNEKSLYIVLRSEPTQLPEENRTSKSYKNFLYTSDKGNQWIKRDEATKTLFGGENILKELERTFKFDGNELENIEANKASWVPKQNLIGPGQYASWTIKVNYGGTLSGRYRIVERVPQGMELAFARLKWCGDQVQEDKVHMCQIPDYKTSLGPDWEEHVISADTDLHTLVDSYYYTNGNKVVWEVDNLVPGYQEDTFAVDFQVVCRVTDPEVLLGGKDKKFVNEVELKTAAGVLLDADSNAVNFKVSTIAKKAVPEGSAISFTININPLGQDLLAGSDEITLVDKMSPSLNLNFRSLEVVNAKTQEKVNFTAALREENTLYVTLPDEVPLTIRYKTYVIAAPGEKVNVYNHAYWYGYTFTDGSFVELPSYTYSIGATADGDKTPNVLVVKSDQNNLTNFLSGAVFELQEGTMKNGKFTPVGTPFYKTTDEKGVAKFGEKPDKALKYNTVYQVKETEAPKGYILDPTPQYVLVAKKDQDDKYPEYPQGVLVSYSGTQFILNVSNHKGEAYVEKNFQDKNGKAVEMINGEYRFALYDDPAAVTPLQTVTLTFDEMHKQERGVFINLELDKTYYIYELDDEGNAIKNGATGIADARPFTVTYTTDNSKVKESHAILAGDTVTVTNQLCVDDLPLTGGHGKALYHMAGFLLVGTGAGLLYKKRRQERKER